MEDTMFPHWQGSGDTLSPLAFFLTFNPKIQSMHNAGLVYRFKLSSIVCTVIRNQILKWVYTSIDVGKEKI